MRRLLLKVHLWLGLVAGLYVVVISVTGAALVFRIDLQRMAHSHLFTASREGPLADPITIMDSVSRAYPDHRLSGVDAPTTGRPTYLAYVTSPGAFKTVLVDPVNAEVLGELPDESWIRSLQDLHYDLFGGRTGRTVNGIGAGAILLMAVTGIYIWWPGRKAWWRAMTIDASRRGQRLFWEMHRAIGIWSVALLLLWAITGLHFAFPAYGRAIISSFSSITPTRTPSSTASAAAGTTPPDARTMIDRARQVHPGGHIARVVLPFGDRGAFLVMFASASPTPMGETLDAVYLDRHTGEPLTAQAAGATAGDVIIRWIAPLHVGAFGGAPVRAVWFIGGLMPPVLFATGVVVWWSRRRVRSA